MGSTGDKLTYGGSSRNVIFKWNFSGTPCGGACELPGQTMSRISSFCVAHDFHTPIYRAPEKQTENMSKCNQILTDIVVEPCGCMKTNLFPHQILRIPTRSQVHNFEFSILQITVGRKFNVRFIHIGLQRHISQMTIKAVKLNQNIFV